MQGALLPVTIEWIILALAPVLFIATCFRDVLWTRGIFGFRNGIVGGPSEVARQGLGDDFTDVYDQLTRLGFQPAGVYRESVALMRSSLEYIFVHPQRKCFAAVYRLFRKDINVMLMTTLEDGTVIKTYDTPGDEFDDADYILQRLPQRSVAKLLEHHESVEDQRIADGGVCRQANTMEAITQQQKEMFFHRQVQDDMRGNGRISLWAKCTTVSSCAGPLLLFAAGFFMFPVVRTMMLLGAAAWTISVCVLFLSMGLLIRLLSTGEKKEVDDTPKVNLFTTRIAGHIYWAGPLIAVATWNFGIAKVALSALVVTSTISALDLIRIFARETKHPFARAEEEA